MTEKEIVEEIKLELTGDLDEMELEIDDQTIANAVKKSLRELQRYWDEMAFVTIPYASCIDLTGTPLEDASSITKVYRIQGQGVSISFRALNAASKSNFCTISFSIFFISP